MTKRKRIRTMDAVDICIENIEDKLEDISMKLIEELKNGTGFNHETLDRAKSIIDKLLWNYSLRDSKRKIK